MGLSEERTRMGPGSVGLRTLTLPHLPTLLKSHPPTR